MSILKSVFSSLSVRVLPLVAAASLAAISGLPVHASQPPKPEYYGVYAVEDTNLLGVSVSWSTYAPPKGQIAVLRGLWPARYIEKTDVVQLSSGVKFLFYFENSGLVTPMMAASQASLRPMFFKRRKTTWNGNERPPRLEKTESANYWDVRDEKIELLMKPIDGQPQMVLAAPPKPLADGVYRFSVGDDILFFSVGSLEAAQQSQCFDEAATYVLAMWSTRLIPCGTSAPAAEPEHEAAPSGGTQKGTSPSSSSAAECRDYDACMQACLSSFKAEDPASALDFATRAAAIKPTAPEPLTMKALVHLVRGEYEQAEGDLNAAFRLRPSLSWNACLERKFGQKLLGSLLGSGNPEGCQRGSLQITDRYVAFLDGNGRPQNRWEIAAVAPSPVAERPASSGNGTVVPLILAAGSKSYRFHFVPSSVAGCTHVSEYVCPSPGLDQQRFVAEYMRKKILELKNSTPSAALPSPTQPATDTLARMEDFVRQHTQLIFQVPAPKRDWRELVALKVWGKFDTYQELYLAAINRRSLAASTLSCLKTFLKKNDLANATKYRDLTSRYYIQSNDLFQAADRAGADSVEMTAQVLNATYRATREASVYGWGMLCGPKCYEIADYVFTAIDFGVDYSLSGLDEATRNIVLSAVTKAVVDVSGLSRWIDTRTTHLVGRSGLYQILDDALANPQLQKAILEVLAKSTSHAAQELTDASVSNLVNAVRDFVASSQDIQPN